MGEDYIYFSVDVARRSPQVGDKRIAKKFLWLPKIIDGDIRWLEKAFWIEKYQYCPEVVGDYCWKPISWVYYE